MTGPSAYVTIIRTLFGAIFVGGSVVHIRGALVSPSGMTAFFVFLLFLGYAFPAGAGPEDFLVNRAGSLVMVALVLPWLLRRQQLAVPGAWSALVRR